jgi:hypothetical protein
VEEEVIYEIMRFFSLLLGELNPNPACETTVDTMDDKPKEVPQATIFLIV